MTKREKEVQIALGTITRTKIFVYGFKKVIYGRIRVAANTQNEANHIIEAMLENGDVEQSLLDNTDDDRFEFDESPKMDDDEEMSRDLTGEEIISIEKDYPDDVYTDTSWGTEDEVQT